MELEHRTLRQLCIHGGRSIRVPFFGPTKAPRPRLTGGFAFPIAFCILGSPMRFLFKPFAAPTLAEKDNDSVGGFRDALAMEFGRAPSPFWMFVPYRSSVPFP